MYSIHLSGKTWGMGMRRLFGGLLYSPREPYSRRIICTMLSCTARMWLTHEYCWTFMSQSLGARFRETFLSTFVFERFLFFHQQQGLGDWSHGDFLVDLCKKIPQPHFSSFLPSKACLTPFFGFFNQYPFWY